MAVINAGTLGQTPSTRCLTEMTAAAFSVFLPD